MFNTFAVTEPTWNNGVGRPKIPKNPAMNVYSFYTFKELLKALQTAKASPDLVAALNQRVSGGIHVPRDFATLEEAAGFFKRYADSDSVSFSMIKDGADAEHKANDDPDFVTIPRKIVLGKGEHHIPKKRIKIVYDSDSDDDINYDSGYEEMLEDMHEKSGSGIPGKDCYSKNNAYNKDGEPCYWPGFQEDLDNILRISSAINIVGDPKEKVVIVGGIHFEKGIEGNCHLQHLTLRKANGTGVYGASSFTMEDVLVEQCYYSGVVAEGTGVNAICTNVEVKECGWNGVLAKNRATITLVGPKTKVHGNCTYQYPLHDTFGLKLLKDDYDDYVLDEGLATIRLVPPLTKEDVSFDNVRNNRNQNWGAGNDGEDPIDQINSMTKAETEAAAAAAAAEMESESDSSESDSSESDSDSDEEEGGDINQMEIFAKTIIE